MEGSNMANVLAYYGNATNTAEKKFYRKGPTAAAKNS
jgi:hypothetical protein